MDEEARIEREILHQFKQAKADLPIHHTPARYTNAHKLYHNLKNYISSAPKFKDRTTNEIKKYIERSGTYPSSSILSSLGFANNSIKNFQMPFKFKPIGGVRRAVGRATSSRRAYAPKRYTARRAMYRKPRYTAYKRRYSAPRAYRRRRTYRRRY